MSAEDPGVTGASSEENKADAADTEPRDVILEDPEDDSNGGGGDEGSENGGEEEEEEEEEQEEESLPPVAPDVEAAFAVGDLVSTFVTARLYVLRTSLSAV